MSNINPSIEDAKNWPLYPDVSEDVIAEVAGCFRPDHLIAFVADNLPLVWNEQCARLGMPWAGFEDLPRVLEIIARYPDADKIDLVRRYPVTLAIIIDAVSDQVSDLERDFYVLAIPGLEEARAIAINWYGEDARIYTSAAEQPEAEPLMADILAADPPPHMVNAFCPDNLNANLRTLSALSEGVKSAFGWPEFDPSQAPEMVLELVAYPPRERALVASEYPSELFDLICIASERDPRVGVQTFKCFPGLFEAMREATRQYGENEIMAALRQSLH